MLRPKGLDRGPPEGVNELQAQFVELRAAPAYRDSCRHSVCRIDGSINIFFCHVADQHLILKLTTPNPFKPDNHNNYPKVAKGPSAQAVGLRALSVKQRKL